MNSSKIEFNPNYAIAPGEILAEHIEAMGISQVELARRCDQSPELIAEIIAGKVPVEPNIALEFERVIGYDANTWLRMEEVFRIHKAKESGTK